MENDSEGKRYAKTKNPCMNLSEQKENQIKCEIKTFVADEKYLLELSSYRYLKFKLMSAQLISIGAYEDPSY